MNITPTVATTRIDGVMRSRKNSSTITKRIVSRRSAVNMGTLTRPSEMSETTTYAMKTKASGATWR